MTAMHDDAPHVLIVDDDPALRNLLRRYLAEQGFHADGVADGEAMWHFLETHRPDLIVMDLMLPGEDGLSLTRTLRGRTNLPVLILSARGEEVDRIVGLEIGADDYLPKPFNPRELVARIRAILRRRTEPPTAPADGARIRFGPYELDLDSHTLHRHGKPVPLTSGEMELLAILARHPNRVLSRDHLIEHLKGYDRSPFDRSIDVRITRLRHKIEPDPKHPRYIHTVRGKGYRFTPVPA